VRLWGLPGEATLTQPEEAATRGLTAVHTRRDLLTAQRLIRAGICAFLLAFADTTTHAGQQSADERPRELALAAGHKTYQQFCAPCHGKDGKGGGPIAATLRVPPADLTAMTPRNRGVFPLAALESLLTSESPNFMAHRSGQMPIWGTFFRSIDGGEVIAHARTANLLAYIESLQER
jgi:mono/diheme cytochrome c family protein